MQKIFIFFQLSASPYNWKGALLHAFLFQSRANFGKHTDMLNKTDVHRTVLILEFARKSYPGPSQPKNNLASKIWNSLPDTYKTLNFLELKQEVLRYEAFPQ